MTIIKGYLNQGKLENALKGIFGNNNWIGSELKTIHRRRMRWDMGFTFGNQKIFVEFDGDSHYRSSLQIKRDLEKDQIAHDNGYQLIRIPYYIQLTNETFSYYFDFFDEQVNIQQNYPHGWIRSKIFPASFCELGIVRFNRELDALPANIRTQVINSLLDKIEKYGKEYVLPSQLNGLIAFI